MPVTREVMMYPKEICRECGLKYGRSVPDITTWNPGTCDICKKVTDVTEPRDFGHLPWPLREKLPEADKC